jgi:hypothetical protein
MRSTDPIIPASPPVRLPDRSVVKPTINTRAVGMPSLTQEVRDLLSATPVTLVLATADQTVNNTTTKVDSTYLKVPVLTNQRWAVTGFLNYSTSAVADIKIALNAPASSNLVFRYFGNDTGGAFITARGSGLDVDSTWNGTGSNNESLVFHLTLLAGGNGNLIVRFAQSTIEVSDTKLLAGCYLIAHRLA